MENNKKQTAVEWLFDNLKSHFEYDGDLLEAVEMSFNIAKEMEKQQIKDAYCNGVISELENYEEIPTDRAEQYYKETYEDGTI